MNTRLKICALFFIAITLLFGCSSDNTAKNKEKDLAEAENKVEEKEQKSDENEQEAGILIEEVSGILLDHGPRSELLDPEGILKKENRKLAIGGNEEYQQLNVLEKQYVQNEEVSSGKYHDVQYFNLYQGVMNKTSAERPLQKVAALRVDINPETGETSAANDGNLPTERDGMEFRIADVFENKLYLFYTNKENKNTSFLNESTRFAILSFEIKRDGTLGKAEELASVNTGVISDGKIARTTDGIALLGFKSLLKLDGSNEVINYPKLEFEATGEPFFYDNLNKHIYWFNDYLDTFTIWSTENFEQIEFQDAISGKGYKKFLFAGYDEKEGYRYFVGISEEGQAMVHVLDDTLNNVFDITPVQTNAWEVTTLEKGFIVWANNIDNLVNQFTGMKIPYIGSKVDEDEFNTHD